MTHAQQQIEEGLVNFGEATGDVASVRVGGMLYKAVAEIFELEVRPGEVCTLAFPTMVIRPDLRVEAFAAVFESRAIVAWRKGMLKKRNEYLSIPFADIAKVDSHVSYKPSTRGAKLLEITAKDNLTLALPKDDAKAADLIQRAFQG